MTNNDEFDPFKQPADNNSPNEGQGSDNPFGNDGLSADLDPLAPPPSSASQSGSGQHDDLTPPDEGLNTPKSAEPPQKPPVVEPEQPPVFESEPATPQHVQAETEDFSAEPVVEPEQPQDVQAVAESTDTVSDDAPQDAPQSIVFHEEDPFAAPAAETESTAESVDSAAGWEDWNETDTAEDVSQNFAEQHDDMEQNMPTGNDAAAKGMGFLKQNFHYIGAGAVGLIALIFVANTFVGGGDATTQDQGGWQQAEGQVPDSPFAQDTAQAVDFSDTPIFSDEPTSLPQPAQPLAGATENEGADSAPVLGGLGNNQTWDQPPMPTPIVNEDAAAISDAAPSSPFGQLAEQNITETATIEEDDVPPMLAGLYDPQPLAEGETMMPPEDALRQVDAPAIAPIAPLTGQSADPAPEQIATADAPPLGVPAEQATGRFSMNDARPLSGSTVADVAVEQVDSAQITGLSSNASAVETEVLSRLVALDQRLNTIQTAQNQQAAQSQALANSVQNDLQKLNDRIAKLENSPAPRQEPRAAAPSPSSASSSRDVEINEQAVRAATSRRQAVETPSTDTVRRKPAPQTSSTARSGATQDYNQAYVPPAPPTQNANIWVLRAAQNGTAWISQGAQGQIFRVEVGNQVAGVGTVRTIRQDTTGRWIVEGSQGRIVQ